jgi:DNA helicase-2/ATP-dependent DNA helicase PcrA
MAVEAVFKEKDIAYYKGASATHENGSNLVDDFQLALRVLANPKDRLHLYALSKKWKVPEPAFVTDYFLELRSMAGAATENKRALAVCEAIEAVAGNEARLDLIPGFNRLEKHADELPEADRLSIYEDLAVFRYEWDQYLRSSATRTLGNFLSSKALGKTQMAHPKGVALLTVHASKGLEFDVVFIAGMAEGTFPDYRATSAKQQSEELRNAFVAVTRAKRLLYLSYPVTRVMPWGGTRRQAPSRFLSNA